jgi:hypothetical protein
LSQIDAAGHSTNCEKQGNTWTKVHFSIGKARSWEINSGIWHAKLHSHWLWWEYKNMEMENSGRARSHEDLPIVNSSRLPLCRIQNVGRIASITSDLKAWLQSCNWMGFSAWYYWQYLNLVIFVLWICHDRRRSSHDTAIAHHPSPIAHHPSPITHHLSPLPQIIQGDFPMSSLRYWKSEPVHCLKDLSNIGCATYCWHTLHITGYLSKDWMAAGPQNIADHSAENAEIHPMFWIYLCDSGNSCSFCMRFPHFSACSPAYRFLRFLVLLCAICEIG